MKKYFIVLFVLLIAGFSYSSNFKELLSKYKNLEIVINLKGSYGSGVLIVGRQIKCTLKEVYDDYIEIQTRENNISYTIFLKLDNISDVMIENKR